MCNLLAFYIDIPAAGTLAQGHITSLPSKAAVAASLLSSMTIMVPTSRHPLKGSQYKATLCSSSNRRWASFLLARRCDTSKLLLRLCLYTFHHRYV